MLGPLITDIHGLSLSESEKAWLMDPLIGGIILFAKNYRDVKQLRALVTDIKSRREAPFFVCVDQEGGPVQRFVRGFTPLPSLSALGQRYDRDPMGACRLAESAGFTMATELLNLGIDVSLAPVLDVPSAKDSLVRERAFHASPIALSTLARHYIAGMKRSGMWVVGKHFPGHGGIGGDTHLDIVQDNRPFREILATDLQPFMRLALDAIMVNHIVYPEVSAEPASCSSYWIQTILRDALGFRGLVMSDDLGMRGLQQVGDIRARIGRALSQGCDMVIASSFFVKEDKPTLLKALAKDNLQSVADERLPPRNRLGVYRHQQVQHSDLWQQMQTELKRVVETYD